MSEKEEKKEKPIIEWIEEGDDIDWEERMELLTQAIKKKNPEGNWFAEVKNFGWRNQDGGKHFNATTGQQLMFGILPKCNCHFKVFDDGEGFKVQNWHHDSPTGNECYYLKPCSADVM